MAGYKEPWIQRFHDHRFLRRTRCPVLILDVPEDRSVTAASAVPADERLRPSDTVTGAETVEFGRDLASSDDSADERNRARSALAVTSFRDSTGSGGGNSAPPLGGGCPWRGGVGGGGGITHCRSWRHHETKPIRTQRVSEIFNRDTFSPTLLY